MLATDYDAMGLRLLQLSHIVCMESEQDILNHVQQKIADVIAKHGELLEQWKSSI